MLNDDSLSSNPCSQNKVGCLDRNLGEPDVLLREECSSSVLHTMLRSFSGGNISVYWKCFRTHTVDICSAGEIE
jgi:hypothetical protein